MTYQSTSAAVRGLPRASLWGIGSYEVDGTLVDFPVGWDDVERDTAWAEQLLRSYELERGDHVLVISGGWEAPWYWPLAQAAINLGATYAATEIWGFDAGRSALFLRRLPIRMVIGLGAEVATGMAATDPLSELLGGVEHVIARPAAVPLLEAEGIRCRRLFPVGPALAIEGPDGGGARVNGAEWEVTSFGGDLHVTTVGPRLHRVRDEPVALQGSVVAADGATDPRVMLADGTGLLGMGGERA